MALRVPLFFLRNSKNRHQRNFRSAVLGSEDNNKKTKRGKKKANLDNLPDVSRVQMEEVSFLQILCIEISNVRYISGHEFTYTLKERKQIFVVLL